MRLWELIAAIVGFLIALLYILTSALAIGLGLAAAVALAVVARIRPLERPGVAGGHARTNAHLETAKLVFLVILQLALLALLIVSAADHWTRQPVGVVAVFALSGLVLMVGIEGNRTMTQTERWWLGADSEEAVGNELKRLPTDQWFVTHNLVKEHGGNIDHIAIGPTGAFAIETKSGRYLGRDGIQARGSAAELRQRIGVQWVTPVVCIPGTDPPAMKHNVWLVPRRDLAQWLQEFRDYRGPRVDVYAARAKLIV